MNEEGTPISLGERDTLFNELIDEVFGLGPLEPLLRDPSISDILVNTHKHVFVERGGLLERVDTQAPRSGQDVQAPRSGQDVQAPRSGQDTQAPRSGQDTQAPRSAVQQAPRSGQDVQAPRSGQDTQAPRGQDTQAPRAVAGAKASSGDAAKLVREAEAACKAGNMGAAKAKAIEAMSILK